MSIHNLNKFGVKMLKILNTPAFKRIAPSVASCSMNLRTIYLSSCTKIRATARDRLVRLAREQKFLQEQTKEIEEQTKEIVKLTKEIVELTQEIVEQTKKIVEQMKDIDEEWTQEIEERTKEIVERTKEIVERTKEIEERTKEIKELSVRVDCILNVPLKTIKEVEKSVSGSTGFKDDQ